MTASVVQVAHLPGSQRAKQLVSAALAWPLPQWSMVKQQRRRRRVSFGGVHSVVIKALTADALKANGGNALHRPIPVRHKS
jgi:hypothetical protein